MRRKRAKPARRRAKQGRARETIAVVLEAAAQVLQREGYARATTNRIAEIAGVSVGTIYQYFANKDEIFDALIRLEIDGLQGLLRGAALDPHEPLSDSLRRLLSALVRARPEAPALYRSLEHVPNALFRRRVAAARGGVVAWVRDFLLMHRRELRVRDLDTAAFVIVSTAEGVAMNATPEFYLRRGADELAALFTRYLTSGSGSR
jgi:AcrR family transcriptional regulator